MKIRVLQPSARRCARLAWAAALACAGLAGGPAWAERITNPVAVFSGLDKISGKISTFDVPIDQTVKFGALSITPRVCYSRTASEDPLTTSFVQVDELNLSKQTQRIFSGWMFAASPGLNGIEHPVYDVWLNDCKGGKSTEPVPPPVATTIAPPPKHGKGRSKTTMPDQMPPDAGNDGDLFDQPIDPTAPQD
ncbi:DUF2155 domain-containing protein [Labrys monachus]|uniref:DUF2155 domain-containing protein n=1 Tax=Labrys monachus TaxID=217067 RepID=A0ABU0FF75_9HYPH|nr:DUF2155 domain-containing protein [Labrys monachus]MDQ0393253.1 hypothetical protein [Labrys monachus]